MCDTRQHQTSSMAQKHNTRAGRDNGHIEAMQLTLKSETQTGTPVVEFGSQPYCPMWAFRNNIVKMHGGVGIYVLSMWT